MKNIITAILASMMIISNLSLTGCGNDNNSKVKSGYSSAEKAAEQYYTAFFGIDADIMMKLMPEECKTYWGNRYNVTENQINEKIEEYLRHKLIRSNEDEKAWKNTNVSVSATHKEKLDIDAMQEINESLSEIQASHKSEEAYKVCVDIESKYNGEVTNVEYYVEVYEYNNKWYSFDADYIVKSAFFTY